MVKKTHNSNAGVFTVLEESTNVRNLCYMIFRRFKNCILMENYVKNEVNKQNEESQQDEESSRSMPYSETETNLPELQRVKMFRFQSSKDFFEPYRLKSVDFYQNY